MLYLDSIIRNLFNQVERIGITLSRKVKLYRPKSTPKILLYDIETAPMLVYSFSLRDTYLTPEQIKEDWYLLSWSAQWLGSPDSEIMYQDLRHSRDPRNDKPLLKSIHKLIDEADIVIFHNGKHFDEPRLKARFIQNGLPCPSSTESIDTLTLSRKFAFSSHKLEYLAEKLTKERKSSHGKFKGLELWKACMRGDLEAYRELEKYNRQDVRVLREVYKELLKWGVPIDFNKYRDTEGYECACGSTRFNKGGFKFRGSVKYQRYRCVSCGSEHTGHPVKYVKKGLKPA